MASVQLGVIFCPEKKCCNRVLQQVFWSVCQLTTWHRPHSPIKCWAAQLINASCRLSHSSVAMGGRVRAPPIPVRVMGIVKIRGTKTGGGVTGSSWPNKWHWNVFFGYKIFQVPVRQLVHNSAANKQAERPRFFSCFTSGSCSLAKYTKLCMIFAAKYPPDIHLQIMAMPLVGHSSRVSAHAWAERWKDRQTDAQQFHRPCSACYVSSANNMVQKYPKISCST